MFNYVQVISNKNPVVKLEGNNNIILATKGKKDRKDMGQHKTNKQLSGFKDNFQLVVQPIMLAKLCIGHKSMKKQQKFNEILSATNMSFTQRYTLYPKIHQIF